MNFDLAKEQEMTRKLVRDFVKDVIAPKAVDILIMNYTILPPEVRF